ncbi:hypothetical protein QWZ13_09280 [Reinekea marina]|nr:hypothetical protein [Reinekea marina]MDN3649100.1 hypothetical protein [Reinekea marina]
MCIKFKWHLLRVFWHALLVWFTVYNAKMRHILNKFIGVQHVKPS